jgi:hypothetical protein
MNLLQTLLSWHHAASPAAIVAQGMQGQPATVAPAQDPPAGCGWFDSSHELRAGLQVREHAANDAVCAELPLAMWFELQRA